MHPDRILVLPLAGAPCEEDALDELWEGSLFDLDPELPWTCVLDTDVAAAAPWLVDGGGGAALVFALAIIVFVEVTLLEVLRLGDWGKKSPVFSGKIWVGSASICFVPGCFEDKVTLSVLFPGVGCSEDWTGLDMGDKTFLYFSSFSLGTLRPVILWTYK